MFLYYASSHLVRHPLRCCMNRSTTALDLGLCNPVSIHRSHLVRHPLRCCMNRSTTALGRSTTALVICSIPRYLFIAKTTPLTNSGASSLRKDRGTPFWRMSPERSARATLSCFLLARNHSVASRAKIYGNKDFSLLVAVEVDAVPLARHGEVFDVCLLKFSRQVLSSHLTPLTSGACAANVKYLSLHLGPVV
jgi:hypothetical protein